MHSYIEAANVSAFSFCATFFFSSPFQLNLGWLATKASCLSVLIINPLKQLKWEKINML